MEDRRTGMGIDSPAEKPARDPSLPLGILSETFPGGVLETALPQGDAVAVVAPGHLLKVMEFLKNDARLRFNMLADVTAVDYLGREPRFDVVYHLVSIPLGQRLRIKVRPADPDPAVDSLVPLWDSANWLEREVWDMFGIRFIGHPDLKRILLYEEFQGHPLRKDYPIRKRQPLIGPKN
jgi:NADH-quinone oxidoreductase subunit C